MDLALVTGRGEPLLTDWPRIDGPLVTDGDVIQVGDRYPTSPVAAIDPGISRITVQEMLCREMDEIADDVLGHFRRNGLRRVWMHVDLDVLDEKVLPAVDSPGQPGLSFAQLSALLCRLLGSGLVLGLNVSIYDPDRDPDVRYAAGIVDCIVAGLK
jgi:arginase